MAKKTRKVKPSAPVVDEGEARGRGLAPEAYLEVPGETYRPYVNAADHPLEFTLRAIFFGIVVGILFGFANAYLGLKVGLTVSASIPAAVMGVAYLRLWRTSTVLEANLIQTIGSAGEALAAGVIFTLPALFLWGVEIGQAKIILIALLSGTLGVLFMIPLRRYLIVREHGRLPYPEGTACAEVLVAGDAGGSKAKDLLWGLGIGGLYQFLMKKDLLGLWPEAPKVRVPGFRGAEVGGHLTPELLGVGFIIGPRIASVMLAGGVLGWLVIIPLIATVGQSAKSPLYPEVSQLISDMKPEELWRQYVRYIGAGAVAFGGIVTLLRSLPTIWESFRQGLAGFFLLAKQKGESSRTQRDLPMSLVFFGALLIIGILASLPERVMPVGWLGALLVTLFAFFFVTVSSRIVGLIGSSSNPVSGMTIATLLITALIFAALGHDGSALAKVAVLTVGSMVCIAAAVAGDTSQDLKTGFLLGATPRYQQIGEFVGVMTSALVMGYVLALFKKPLVTGELAAPQANMMALVIDGVLNESLPWTLVIVGIVIAATVEMLALPSLALAVGLYLPLSLSTPIMLGGLIRWWIEHRNRDARLQAKRERGILYASGLIAGAALVGVLAQFLYVLAERSHSVENFLDHLQKLTKMGEGHVAIGMFLLMAATLFAMANYAEPAGKGGE